MNFEKHILIPILIIFPLGHAYSQYPERQWEQSIELIAEDHENEEDISELKEKLMYYTLYPVNLNDINSKDLLQLGFINDFQWNALRAYIAQNGNLRSIYELELIHGFNPETIQMISPFVYIGSLAGKEKPRFRNFLKHGKHSFALGGRTVVEKQKGYTERTPEEIEKNTGTRYIGSSYRSYFKYQFNSENKILFGIAAEKDPGEQFSLKEKPYGFDYYGAYVMIKNTGIIENAIAGNYHLQFGQGLTLWTGAGFSIISGTVVKKYAQGIKPASSFSEYGQMQGFAVTLNPFKKLKWTLFISGKERDAVLLEKDSEEKAVSFQSFTKTGYHRTKKEIEERNAVKENIFGTHLQYNFLNANVGLTIYRTKLSAEWKPLGIPYNYFAFHGRENYNTGIDFNYLLGKLTLFGEVAMSRNQGKAVITGLQTYFSENILFSSYYRYYAPQYYSLYSSALGQNGANMNEQGIFFILQTLLPFYIQMTASADIFSFPWLKYQVNNPFTYGNEFKINLVKQIQRETNFSVQYRFKEKPYNTTDDTAHVRYAEQTYRQGLQFRINVRLSKQWSFDSRAEYIYYHSESKSKTNGFLIAQDINYSPDKIPIRISTRYALFDTDEWDTRIYAYEKDLVYEFSVPAYYGKGSRFYILVRWDIYKKMDLDLRYSFWYYPDKETVGSGLDEIKGSKKQEVKLCLRISF